MSLEIINSVATVISSVMAFITVWLVVKHYNDSKKSDTRHFWYRNYILDNNFKECENIFENILSIFKNLQLEETEKLIKLKEEFNNLREYFYKTKFFDENLYTHLDNFINLCEEECISRETEKLIKLKEEFNNLREYFYKTKFFDENLYTHLDNFINLCEEECISRFNSIDSEDISRMKNVFLKSLFEYELNDYKDFTIKY